MNFKNRLEALKWMCENPGERVFFDSLDGGSRMIAASVDLGGQIINYPRFLNDGCYFRTTPEYIPDPKPEPEFEWSPSLRLAPLGSSVTYRDLLIYHDNLIKFLDKRFIRK